MSSEMPSSVRWSAAWRISFWGTLVFALGSVIIFFFLHQYIAADIERRNDAWLWGEAELLGEIAERTPRDALYSQVVSEIAQIVWKELPTSHRSARNPSEKVFFLQASDANALQLWVGPGDGESVLRSLRQVRIPPDRPIDLQVAGSTQPFRVVSILIEDGSRIYVGLSEEDQLQVLGRLRTYFFLLWLAIVSFGFALIFVISRGLLKHVQTITDAASRIGRLDLRTRVPESSRGDEVDHLAVTLNRMLDRINSSMQQLHTMADSLAHDIRSPITSVRGRLEQSLHAASAEEQSETIVSSIEVLDRLSQFLNDSLDVAEAHADALRLVRTEIDLRATLLSMVDLYQPSTAEKSLNVGLRCDSSVKMKGDAGLIHRMLSNLFDNEVTHLPPGCNIDIHLHATDSVILIFEDDGPGFPPDAIPHLFEPRVKGRNSNGRGLGLAVVDAVVRAHSGTISGANRVSGGARIAIRLPFDVQ